MSGCDRTFGIFRQSPPCGKTPAREVLVGMYDPWGRYGKHQHRLCNSCVSDLLRIGYSVEAVKLEAA